MIGRLAGDNGTGAISVYLGDDKIGETMVSKKGPDYDTYEDISGGKVTLKAGDYDLKIQIEVDWVNIDYVEFKKVEAPVESSSSTEPTPESSSSENPDAIGNSLRISDALNMDKAQYFDMAGNRISKASAQKQGAFLVRIPGAKTFVVRNEK